MTELTVDDDGILNLPDDLLEEMGWKEGDELVFEDQGDGSFSIRKGREGALNALDRIYEENHEGLRRLAQEDN